MKKLSLVIPYYNHPNFLKFQTNVWNGYSDKIKEEVDIIVVDDGSAVPINEVPGITFPGNVELYRILEDIPWNEKGARNLGAHEAETDWIIHLDFDHWIDEENLSKLIQYPKVKSNFYRFNRLRHDRDGVRSTNRHREIHMISRDVFNSICFDEDFSGTYGSSAYTWYFECLAKKNVIPRMIDDVVIHQELRGLHPDSGCPGDRDELKKSLSGGSVLRQKRTSNEISVNKLKFKWVIL